jgi:hypothetical protein
MTLHNFFTHPKKKNSENIEKIIKKSSFNVMAIPSMTLKLDDMFRDSALHVPEHLLKNKIPK